MPRLLIAAIAALCILGCDSDEQPEQPDALEAGQVCRISTSPAPCAMLAARARDVCDYEDPAQAIICLDGLAYAHGWGDHGELAGLAFEVGHCEYQCSLDRFQRCLDWRDNDEDPQPSSCLLASEPGDVCGPFRECREVLTFSGRKIDAEMATEMCDWLIPGGAACP